MLLLLLKVHFLKCGGIECVLNMLTRTDFLQHADPITKRWNVTSIHVVNLNSMWTIVYFVPLSLSNHNPESAPKFTAGPRSTVFSKSANPFNLPQKSKIRALFKAKSVDSKTYSPPSNSTHYKLKTHGNPVNLFMINSWEFKRILMAYSVKNCEFFHG